MTPLSISMENFLCHADSFLDLSNTSLALIVGEIDGSSDDSNGSGKSTIFEAICWALYGKINRAEVIDDVIRDGENFCSVALILEVNNNKYKILRKKRRDSSSDLLLYIFRNDEWDPCSGRTIADTNKKIIDLVKFNYETFINSIYFLQESLIDFADKTAGQKLDLLKKLLNLILYDKYKKSASKNVIKLEGNLETLQDNIKTFVDEIQKEDNYKEELSLILNNYSKSEDKLFNLESELQNLTTKLSQLQESNKKIKELNDLFQEYEESRKNTEYKRQDYASFYDDFKLLDFNNMKNSWGHEHEHYQKINAWLQSINKSNLEQTFFNLQEAISKTQGRIDTLKETMVEIIKAGDKCHLCETPLPDDKKRKIKSDKQSNISKLSIEIDNLNAQCLDAKRKLDEYNDKERDLLKVKATLDNLQHSMETYNLKADQLVSKEKIYKEAAQSFSDITAKYNNLRSQVDNNVSNEISNIQNKISSIQNDININKNIMSNYKIEEGKLKQSLQNIENLKNNYLDKQKEINNLIDKINVEKYIVGVFGKIPKYIINSAISEIEFYTNEILATISIIPMSIEIAPDSFSITTSVDGDIKKVKMLSTGQRTRVSIALRLGLSKFLSNRTGGEVKILLLDEISSYLDRGSIENMCYIINNLAKSFKILLISHDERLRSYFSDQIKVSMNNKVSTIIQG